MNREQRLIDWLTRSGTLLETQIIGSGLSSTLDKLLADGRAEIVAHPTVKDGKAPASAVVLRKKA